MKAEILTIGDEVMRGEIVDTNKSFLADRLLGLDIETHFQTSVRDDPPAMADAFQRAATRSEIALVSGGLGPTRDDLTATVLAEAFGLELVLDEAALETIRSFFHSRGREMTENNVSQARFPEGAYILPNPLGTAPGFSIAQGMTRFFCLPGVPNEMHRMMDEQVLPRIEAIRGEGLAVRARLIRTFGMGESTLDDELKDIAASGDVSLGFRTSFPDNYLRPLARAATAEQAEATLDRICDVIKQRLGPLVYGEDQQTLDAVVGQMLAERGMTIAVAESCTGGMIASRITDNPGSSTYFAGGVVAYSNAAKSALLGVSTAALEEHGAVSDPVVRAMAEGVRERFGVDIGVATTGISGPDGGTATKPVGLVHIALAREGAVYAESFVFRMDRARHRLLTSQIALDWVRRTLLGVELVGPKWAQR
ncbi:MAG: competence/damage-inducible protein A [Myxococcota bacterium]